MSPSLFLFDNLIIDRGTELPKLLEDQLVLKIAKAHAKTPAQVLLRHLAQQGVIVIPKSVTKKRIEENFNASFAYRASV